MHNVGYMGRKGTVTKTVGIIMQDDREIKNLEKGKS